MVKHTQAIRQLLSMNSLSVFDHFVGLALKRLKYRKRKLYVNPGVDDYYFLNIKNFCVTQEITKQYEYLDSQNFLR